MVETLLANAHSGEPPELLEACGLGGHMAPFGSGSSGQLVDLSRVNRTNAGIPSAASKSEILNVRCYHLAYYFS